MNITEFKSAYYLTVSNPSLAILNRDGLETLITLLFQNLGTYNVLEVAEVEEIVKLKRETGNIITDEEIKYVLTAEDVTGIINTERGELWGN